MTEIFDEANLMAELGCMLPAGRAWRLFYAFILGQTYGTLQAICFIRLSVCPEKDPLCNSGILLSNAPSIGRLKSVYFGSMSKMRRWSKSVGALETTFCVGGCGWSVVWASAMPSLSFELLPQICEKP